MEKHYVIKQNTKSTYYGLVTKYCESADRHHVMFTDEQDKAKKYPSIEKAREDMKMIFAKIAYHINIQYEIVEI